MRHIDISDNSTLLTRITTVVVVGCYIATANPFVSRHHTEVITEVVNFLRVTNGLEALVFSARALECVDGVARRRTVRTHTRIPECALWCRVYNLGYVVAARRRILRMNVSLLLMGVTSEDICVLELREFGQHGIVVVSLHNVCATHLANTDTVTERNVDNEYDTLALIDVREVVLEPCELLLGEARLIVLYVERSIAIFYDDVIHYNDMHIATVERDTSRTVNILKVLNRWRCVTVALIPVVVTRCNEPVNTRVTNLHCRLHHCVVLLLCVPCHVTADNAVCLTRATRMIDCRVPRCGFALDIRCGEIAPTLEAQVVSACVVCLRVSQHKEEELVVLARCVVERVVRCRTHSRIEFEVLRIVVTLAQRIFRVRIFTHLRIGYRQTRAGTTNLVACRGGVIYILRFIYIRLVSHLVATLLVGLHNVVAVGYHYALDRCRSILLPNVAVEILLLRRVCYQNLNIIEEEATVARRDTCTTDTDTAIAGDVVECHLVYLPLSIVGAQIDSVGVDNTTVRVDIVIYLATLICCDMNEFIVVGHRVTDSCVRAQIDAHLNRVGLTRLQYRELRCHERTTLLATTHLNITRVNAYATRIVVREVRPIAHAKVIDQTGAGRKDTVLLFATTAVEVRTSVVVVRELTLCIIVLGERADMGTVYGVTHSVARKVATVVEFTEVLEENCVAHRKVGRIGLNRQTLIPRSNGRNLHCATLLTCGSVVNDDIVVGAWRKTADNEARRVVVLVSCYAIGGGCTVVPEILRTIPTLVEFRTCLICIYVQHVVVRIVHRIEIELVINNGFVILGSCLGRTLNKELACIVSRNGPTEVDCGIRRTHNAYEQLGVIDKLHTNIIQLPTICAVVRTTATECDTRTLRYVVELDGVLLPYRVVISVERHVVGIDYCIAGELVVGADRSAGKNSKRDRLLLLLFGRERATCCTIRASAECYAQSRFTLRHIGQCRGYEPVVNRTATHLYITRTNADTCRCCTVVAIYPRPIVEAHQLGERA